MHKSISELQTRYLDFRLHYGNVSPKTIQAWFYCIRSFIRTTGIEDLQNVSREVIEDYLLKCRLNKKWAAKTTKNELGYLKKFFDWCVERNYLDHNPAEKIPAPKLPKRLPKSLSRAEAEKLLQWTKAYQYKYPFEKNRAVAIMAMFIFAGLRRGELENLMIGDVDLGEKSIFIHCGKGEKDRIVPIAPGLMRPLEMYMNDRERFNKKCPFFFVGSRGDHKLGDKVIRRLVEKIRNASGIYFYPHMLRHTFATLMLEGGVNLFDLSKMMGHSDIKTTTIYLSTSIGRLKDQIVKHPMNF